MSTVSLDHVTVRTTRLAESLRFYDHFLGLRPGPRPPFEAPGAWLYAEGSGYAILHLIEVEADTPGSAPPDTGRFDHFALRVAGLADYLAKVRASGGWHRATPVVSTDLVQIHHRDPNGVTVEATFAGEVLAEQDIVL